VRNVVRVLAAHALEFLVALRHGHELAPALVALGPGCLVLKLALGLSALLHRPDTMIVAHRFVAGHEIPLWLL
jgi:hypothetical protein